MPIDKSTFCLAPWFSVFLDSRKKIAPCCAIEGERKYSYNQLTEYFNSSELQTLRHDLLNGVKNKNCDTCWKQEESGGDSLRLITNRTIGLFTSGSLSDQIADPKVSNIKSFDLTLGNLCNLKCVMCSPTLSSQLLAEANLNPHLHERYEEKYNQGDFDWPKQMDFVEWCNKNLPQAVHIKFTGGEPFIIPWIGDAIEHIPDDQKKNCVLHFTTNLTTINEKLLHTFRKFKQVWLSVSVEGEGDTFEYIRYGHKWKTLTDNIGFIQDMNVENLVLSISHVLQAPSYHSIIAMTKYFDDKNISIRPIMVEGPEHLHILSLTEKAKLQFLADTQDYAGHNKKFIDYVRNNTELHIDQDKGLTKKLVTHLSDFDKVRKNSYKDIIPVENLS
jgi:sulfatase maturation enzyme AslB (radical SAM superfamily)